MDINSPYPWEQQVKVTHWNCLLVHTTRHDGYCQLKDIYNGHLNLTEPSKLPKILWLESGQELTVSNSGEIHSRYHKRMILLRTDFPKTFYCVFASRIPLYSKEGVRPHWKWLTSRTFLWYLEYPPFSLGKIVMCCEYFTKCLAEVLYYVLGTYTLKCFVNPHPGCPVLLSRAGTKLFSEGRSAFFCCTTDGSDLARKASLTFPIGPAGTWHAWMVWEVPSHISHIKKILLPQALSHRYSKPGSSASWHAWWGQWHCIVWLCQSCLPGWFPWKPVENSCALLFHKNLFQDNRWNIPEYYSYGWNCLTSDECPFLYRFSIVWEEVITVRKWFTWLKAPDFDFCLVSLTSEFWLIETTDTQ